MGRERKTENKKIVEHYRSTFMEMGYKLNGTRVMVQAGVRTTVMVQVGVERSAFL